MSGCVFCLIATVAYAMDTTTPSSTSDAATTEDTKGRILSLPDLEKCKTSNYAFFVRPKIKFLAKIKVKRLRGL